MLRTRLLSIAFVLGTIFLPALAWSDEPYEPRIVPQCKVYVTQKGIQVCGYSTVEDWKLVLDADSELFALRETLKKKDESLGNLNLQITNLEGQVTAHTKAVDALTARNAALTQQLIDLDEKYQQELVKPQWGDPLAWGIAGVSLSVLAGFLLAQAF